MVPQLRSLWQEERGGTALTLIWFMFAALSMAIALDAFFGVYIALQQSRTASDAARLATSRAIATYLEETVEDEASKRVQRLMADPVAQEEIEKEVDALDAAQAACVKLAPDCKPLTATERAEIVEGIKVRVYQDAFPRLFRGTLSEGMARLIVQGTWYQTDSVTKRDRLIPDDIDLGCLVQKTATQQRSGILQEAEDLARANGSSLDWSRTTLAQSNGWHSVTIIRTVRPFGADWIFPDGGYPKLHISGQVMLHAIGKRTPQYIPSC